MRQIHEATSFHNGQRAVLADELLCRRLPAGSFQVRPRGNVSRKLAITARQITALCKGAAKVGWIAEVVIGNATVRFLPDANAKSRKPQSPHASWSGPDLNFREDSVLATLVEAKGAPLAAGSVNMAGPKTVNSLLAYGLVALDDGIQDFDKTHNIRATKEGLSFIKRRKDHYENYPSL